MCVFEIGRYYANEADESRSEQMPNDGLSSKADYKNVVSKALKTKIRSKRKRNRKNESWFAS